MTHVLLHGVPGLSQRITVICVTIAVSDLLVHTGLDTLIDLQQGSDVSVGGLLVLSTKDLEIKSYSSSELQDGN